MFTRVSMVLTVLALVGLAAGCGKSPVTQYDAGRSALESAKLAQAEQYAPALYKEAADSLDAAMVEMQKQDGKFFALRSYGRAEEIIAAAQQLAQEAQETAAAEKEKMRVADSALVEEIGSLMVQTKAALASAPKAKGSRIDLKMMQSDVDAAAQALSAATADYQAGNYATAHAKLQSVKEQVLRVKNGVDTALARVGKK